jgi:hypothetical protein
VNGSAVWNNDKLWKIIGEEGQKLGLEWGGSWKSIIDKPHFQLTGGLTPAQLRAGKRPPWWNEKPALNLEEAIKVLQGEGIIGSPDYWCENAVIGGTIKGEYAGKLIINMANKLRG